MILIKREAFAFIYDQDKKVQTYTRYDMPFHAFVIPMSVVLDGEAFIDVAIKAVKTYTNQKFLLPKLCHKIERNRFPTELELKNFPGVTEVSEHLEFFKGHASTPDGISLAPFIGGFWLQRIEDIADARPPVLMEVIEAARVMTSLRGEYTVYRPFNQRR